MDPDNEVFDVVDDKDRVIGTQHRGTVHSQGLLHRAVDCWVFDATGRLLLQRRSPDKKIAGGLLDLSVSEHLQAGETYRQAIIRGLLEELGIDVEGGSLHDALSLWQTTHRRELHDGDVHDVELVQSFRLDGYTGPVACADGEVSAVEWVELAELARRVAAGPELFTPWFQTEVVAVELFSEAH
jgi:isopentenyl-diphosphate delta-isomerase type 1